MKHPIDEWAQILFNNHKNPVLKLELPGTKMFIPSYSEDERTCVRVSLDTLQRNYMRDRVNRRCSRMKVNWLQQEKLAEMVKPVGNVLQHFGYSDKSVMFLLPEEALFLLEMNRIELFLNGYPMSVQQAFETILENNSCTSDKYRVFKRLTIEGFKIRGPPISRKRLPTFESEPPKKKYVLDVESTSHSEKDRLLDDAECSLHDDAKEVFSRLKFNGPKQCSINLTNNFDYKVFSPAKANKTSYTLNLMKQKIFDPKYGFCKGDVPNLLAVVAPDLAAFYQICSVNLPDLF